VSEEAVFSLEQYVCEMALATLNSETKASHNMSRGPKRQERLLRAIVAVGCACAEVGARSDAEVDLCVIAPRAIGDDQTTEKTFSTD
jgi:hypothetical protein